MTTTVTVKARAHGAVVEIHGEKYEIAPHRQQDFHIEEGSQTFAVTQPTEADAAETDVAADNGDRAEQLANEEVPGREQNDKLLGAGKRTATPPTGNKTGADETTARSS